MICWLFVFLRKPSNESDAKSDAWFENDVQMFFDVFVDGLSMFVSACFSFCMHLCSQFVVSWFV